MSREKTTSMKFSDDISELCAVRTDSASLEEAIEIAKEKLFTDNVVQTDEYRYMHHGFGKDHSGDVFNTWWLTDSIKKNSVPVYVFREAE